MEKTRAEQIRRREISRALKDMNLSSKEKEVVERLSCSLVIELLRDPLAVSVTPRVRVGTSEAGRDACAS